jgi:hypothetical protein
VGLREGTHGRTDAQTHGESPAHLSLKAERHSTGPFPQRVQGCQLRLRQVPQVRRDAEERIHLGQRAERHTERVGKLSCTKPGMPLRNIRYSGHRSSSKLQRQPEPLLCRESRRDPIDLPHQLTETLPRHQPPVLVHRRMIAPRRQITSTVPPHTAPFLCVRASVRPCVF